MNLMTCRNLISCCRAIFALFFLCFAALVHANDTREIKQLHAFSYLVGIASEEDPGKQLGSGVIVDSDGYVLTASSIIESPSNLVVITQNGNRSPAQVTGVDRRRGLLLLKIDPLRGSSVAPVALGRFIIGLKVRLASFEQVSDGNALLSKRPQGPYIVFDSQGRVGSATYGSALINATGEVLGINTHVFAKANEARTLAVPIREAMAIYEELRLHGSARRGTINIAIQDVTADLATAYGLANTHGALVSHVPTNGAGYQAGIRAGDVILELDGHAIEESQDIPAIMLSVKPGQVVVAKVWRHGSISNIKIVVAEAGTQQ